MIASGIVNAAKQVGLEKPLVIRLEGTNAQEGKRIIDEATGLHAVSAIPTLLTSSIFLARLLVFVYYTLSPRVQDQPHLSVVSNKSSNQVTGFSISTLLFAT